MHANEGGGSCHATYRNFSSHLEVDPWGEPQTAFRKRHAEPWRAPLFAADASVGHELRARRRQTTSASSLGMRCTRAGNRSPDKKNGSSAGP